MLHSVSEWVRKWLATNHREKKTSLKRNIKKEKHMLIPAKTWLDCQTFLGIWPSENTCTIYLYIYIFIYIYFCLFFFCICILYKVYFIVLLNMLKRENDSYTVVCLALECILRSWPVGRRFDLPSKPRHCHALYIVLVSNQPLNHLVHHGWNDTSDLD